MMDKFKIFNKIKIDTDKYQEVETNNEELKTKMLIKINSSKRSMIKRKINNRVIGSVAAIGIVMLGIGVVNPSLADNLKKRLPEFETMLDKIKSSIDNQEQVEYDPSIYPEREEEKQDHKKSKLIATPINVSSKNDGLEITIDKAMYDKKKLYLDMTLKTDEPFSKSKYKNLVGESVYVDGIPYKNWTTVSEEKVGSEKYAPRLLNIPYIDETIYKDVNLRKFTMCFYGGFDGWDVNRDSRTNTDKFKASKYNVDGSTVFSHVSENGLNTLLNLPSTAITTDYYAYLAGYRKFANPEDVDINLFATPGINWFDNMLLTEDAIDVIEDTEDGRGGDALYIMNAPTGDYDP